MKIKEQCPINRIILIGNGFDLAHGLRTSYRDFINWLWNGVGTSCGTTNAPSFENNFVKISVPGQQMLSRVFLTGKQPYTYNKVKEVIKDQEGIISFTIKNKFLEYISEINDNVGWVDIENAYYQKLKECIKAHQDETERHQAVEKLNREFEDIKNALEDYLPKYTEKQRVEYPDHVGDCIIEDFRYTDFNTMGQEELNNYEWRYLQQLKAAQETGSDTLTEWQVELLEQSKDMTQKDITDILNKKYLELMQVHPRRILFLNFNYTKTDSPYHGYVRSWSSSEPDSIYIHGLLNDKDNPIIFGYGDELDENYKELERANDNLFLENIKSVRYLFTNNYTRLSSFVESAPYQVYIFEHSCGNSDRTLLHYLFEHPNCVSIKPFYYKNGDGQDNYMDIASNITRAFNDKHALRTRVVNRSDCKPLPQKH